jgi:anti-sigma B factor antagonist
MEFQISSAELGRGVQIVSLGGEVDVHTAPRLDEELAGAIETGARRLVVDLAGTSFVDSTVVGVLMRAQRRLDDMDGHLVLVSDDPRILRIFQITGLESSFAIERSLAETISKLSSGEAA